MNTHDEIIRKANREIERLMADIEKRKARIAGLRATIKQHEAQKAHDLQFSDNVLELMNSNGIKTDEERKAVLAKIEEYFRTLEAEKGEEIQQEETPESVSETKIEPATETEETEENPTTTSAENYRTAPTSNYQNPAYPYRTTNNGNYNS